MVDKDQRARLVMWTLIATAIGQKGEIHLVTFFLFALPRREEWQGHFKIVWFVSGGQRVFPLSISIAFNSQIFFFTGRICRCPQLRKARGKRSADNIEKK